MPLIVIFIMQCLASSKKFVEVWLCEGLMGVGKAVRRNAYEHSVRHVCQVQLR